VRRGKTWVVTPGTVTLLPNSGDAGSALTVPGTVEADSSLTVAAPVAGAVVRAPLQPAQEVAPASTAPS
jgi:hypothetical protein